MTTVNYPRPVTVNGYSCKNCTDVDYAKRHTDPAHPKNGPYGVNAKTQPVSPASFAQAIEKPAVVLGGAFADASATANSNVAPTATQGLRLDVSA